MPTLTTNTKYEDKINEKAMFWEPFEDSLSSRKVTSFCKISQPCEEYAVIGLSCICIDISSQALSEAKDNTQENDTSNKYK